MTSKLKLLLSMIFSLSAIHSLYSQTLIGSLFNEVDSLPMMFVNVVQVDSTGNVLTRTSTNENGEFTLRLLNHAEMIRISHLPEFAEIQATNLIVGFGDTLNLDKLPMIKAPNYLQVQFKDISDRKERRNQRQLINDYNKKIKEYTDRILEINGQQIRLTNDYYKQKDKERLQLIYVLNLKEIK